MLKKIVSTIGIKAISAILNFLIIILTARYLGAEGRGAINLIIATITFILLFSHFVGGTTLIYLTPRQNISDLIFSSYLWALLICTIAYLAGILFQLYNGQDNLHIYFLSLLFSLLAINLNILIGKEDIKANNQIGFLQIAFHFILLCCFFLFLHFRHLFYFILSLYISFGFAFIVSCFFIRKHLHFKFSSNIIRVGSIAITYGFISQLGNISQFLNYRLSYYFLNHYATIADVGVYSTGVSLAEAVWLIGGSIALIQYSKISNTQDVEQSKILTVKLFKLSFFLSAIALIALMLLPTNFYVWMFGEQFAELKHVIFTLSAGIIAIGFSIVFSHYFAGIGKYHINAITSFAGLIITVILNIILIPEFGISGAGWASSSSYLVISVLLVVIYLRQTKTRFSEILPKISDMRDFRNQIKILFA